MDCADHCICGDGDTDGAGSNLLYVGVLDKKSVLEIKLQDALLSADRRNILLFNVSLFSFAQIFMELFGNSGIIMYFCSIEYKNDKIHL